MTGISLPSTVNITEGQNATIQVSTGGDPSGGLYNCADITFSSTATLPSSSVCNNNTGVVSSAATGNTHPNGTALGATSASSPSSPTSPGSAASPSTTKNAAVQVLEAGLGSLAMAAAAALAIVL